MTRSLGGPLDQRAHLGDLAGQRPLVQQAIGHVAVEGVERAEAVARIRPAQILLHLPDHAAPRHDERIMDLPRESDALVRDSGTVAPEHGERVEPHGEVVEILTVAVRLFADADAARAAENAIDLGDQPFGLVKVALLAQRFVERDEKHEPEGIGPQIAQAVRPDPLFTHPIELLEHIGRIGQSAHRRTRSLRPTEWSPKVFTRKWDSSGLIRINGSIPIP